mmetsp:Transcript_11376/g.21086  ORF Transcript_11376/g.21086 Transcript_11376/m.21086 type:complete len:218 (+) Transcript_11376:485-1138(+)
MRVHASLLLRGEALDSTSAHHRRHVCDLMGISLHATVRVVNASTHVLLALMLIIMHVMVIIVVIVVTLPLVALAFALASHRRGGLFLSGCGRRGHRSRAARYKGWSRGVRLPLGGVGAQLGGRGRGSLVRTLRVFHLAFIFRCVLHILSLHITLFFGISLRSCSLFIGGSVSVSVLAAAVERYVGLLFIGGLQARGRGAAVEARRGGVGGLNVRVGR